MPGAIHTIKVRAMEWLDQFLRLVTTRACTGDVICDDGRVSELDACLIIFVSAMLRA
jgi:hypothetical protein